MIDVSVTSSLRILIDTNVVIAAESDADNLHANAGPATELYRLATELKHTLCIGAGTRDDIERHKNAIHKRKRRQQLERYLVLERLEIPDGFQEKADYPLTISEQSRVDLMLLLLLYRGAVQWFVTEDQRILPHARELGLEDRVFSLSDALDVLARQRLQPISVPAVEEIKGYELDPDDTIFDDFASTYEIRDWLQEKVAAEARPCLIMKQRGDNIDAVAILKEESDNSWTLPGKVLKICTFKVSPMALGVKRGELLLWAIFQHARANGYDSIFIEVFEKEKEVVVLFQSFGFTHEGYTHREGEIVMGKLLKPPEGYNVSSPLAFNISFGPGALAPDRLFLVPIVPKWHENLFPVADDSAQLTLYNGMTDQGNAMRKAYVCHSAIKHLRAGDTLLFLRTHERQMVNVVGVVEETLRSSDPVGVLEFTGRRTVYTPNEISAMCSYREVLAIRFRLDQVLDTPLSLNELVHQRVMTRSPQSIQQVKDQGAVQWLKTVLGV